MLAENPIRPGTLSDSINWEVVKAMESRWPQAARVLAAGEEDVLTYMIFPPTHWPHRQIVRNSKSNWTHARPGS